MLGGEDRGAGYLLRAPELYPTQALERDREFFDLEPRRSA